jgi:hypothetical protein
MHAVAGTVPGGGRPCDFRARGCGAGASPWRRRVGAEGAQNVIDWMYHRLPRTDRLDLTLCPEGRPVPGLDGGARRGRIRRDGDVHGT